MVPTGSLPPSAAGDDGDMTRMLGVRPNFSFLLCCCKRTWR